MQVASWSASVCIGSGLFYVTPRVFFVGSFALKGVWQRFKVDFTLFKFRDEPYQVGQISSQPVEPPDNAELCKNRGDFTFAVVKQ
jgi:hypothetical protein